MCGCALSVVLLTLAVVLPTPHDYSGTCQGEYSARFTASELQVTASELQVTASELQVTAYRAADYSLRAAGSYGSCFCVNKLG